MCQKENEQDELNGRRSDADVEQLKRDVEALRLQAVAIQATLDTIKDALVGNGGPGVRTLVDDMALLVEKMGRLFEDSHRQGRLQAEVIESLLQKLQLEKILVDVLAVWQAHSLAQTLGTIE